MLKTVRANVRQLKTRMNNPSYKDEKGSLQDNRNEFPLLPLCPPLPFTVFASVIFVVVPSLFYLVHVGVVAVMTFMPRRPMFHGSPTVHALEGALIIISD